jgi:hypothetical protein
VDGIADRTIGGGGGGGAPALARCGVGALSKPLSAAAIRCWSGDKLAVLSAKQVGGCFELSEDWEAVLDRVVNHLMEDEEAYDRLVREGARAEPPRKGRATGDRAVHRLSVVAGDGGARGARSIDLQKLERLLELRAAEHARTAAQLFRKAMTACQSAMEPIRADSKNDQSRRVFMARSIKLASANRS